MVALAATGIGAVVGAGAFLGIAGSTFASIGAIAGVVSGVASIGSSLLAKTPPARGSVTQTIISTDAPMPYVMGEGYVGGVLRHDTAYGATINKVPNPYRWMPTIYSGGGPIQGFEPYVDKAPLTTWYDDYLWVDTQLGTLPESTALAPTHSGAPGWDSTSKLSGFAAIGWNLKFDKDAKRFASGVPEFGAHGQWVKVYDPRLDSTFPGGSGAHRVNNEATWAWSENPALHAGVYAYGRYQNGKRVFGIGMPADGIDWACVAAWANVCDANAWTIFGRIFEPGNRWQNLKDIAAAGGAQPIASSRGLLSFKYNAPQVALDTITAADLADGPVRVTSMQSWGERINTIIPKYTSADHDWQQVAAGEVSVPTYVTEDGEIKSKEWPWNLVKDAEQVAQLAAYVLVDTRELTPIVIPCGPRMRAYRPGECLEIDLPEYGLSTDAIILQREVDPATMTVTLTMVGETPDKHAYALGQTADPPATPALGQTAEERDELAAAAADPSGFVSNLILTSFIVDADPLDGLLQATEDSITIETHGRNYSDKVVSVTGDTLTVEDDGTTAIVDETLYHIYYDDDDREGGAVTLLATQDSQTAATTAGNPTRHYVGSIRSDEIGGTGSSGGGTSPPGWNPPNYNGNPPD